MKDKTKRIIVNTVTALAGLYGVVGLAAYVLPMMVLAAIPVGTELASHFILIPLAMAVMFLTVVTPLALLVLSIMLVELIMCKLLGLKTGL